MAATIASGIVEADLVTPTVVFAGLVGAITWNLITWYYGLPSSSSHALIGGVVGSAFVAEGADAVIGEGLIGKVAVPAIVAPTLAFGTAALAILFAYRIIGRQSPGTVNRGFRVGQIASGGMLALAHGTNDAQKTMGVITLALIANGTLGGGVRPADLGDRHLGSGDLPGYLRRRLADHPHDGQPHHQDGHGAGLRGAGVRRGGDPRCFARRVPPFDDPHDFGRRDGRRRGETTVRRALGRGGQHHPCVGADDSGVRARGRRDLRARLAVR